MADFIDVWDTRTGKPRSAPVPEHFLNHPVLGKHLTDKPPTEPAGGISLPENAGKATKPKAGKTAEKEK